MINCEVNLILTWSSTCVITNSTGEGTFAITDTNLPVVTLSNEDNTKLHEQLKSGFKSTINWNRYQSDPKTCAQNRYLNHLVDKCFHGVNRLFVLSFENDHGRTSHSECYLPKVEDYNFMIDCKNFFDQTRNNDIETYENIRKIATGPDDDYTTGCLLDYPCFKENYKLIPIDLSKQQALDAGPTAIQQINFTANLDRAGNTTFFITEEAKETVLGFSQRVL